MKMEGDMFVIHPDYDKTVGLEPFWYIEAASLVEKIMCDCELELQRVYDPDSEFAKKLSDFSDFEDKVVQRGRSIMENLPQLNRYEIKCKEGTTYNYLLRTVAVFMYYRDLGLLKDPVEFKRRFFLTQISELDDVKYLEMMEDFATFYRIVSKESEESADVMMLLDFHMNFEERFNEAKDAILLLADMIKSEAKKIRYLWESKKAEDLLFESNEIIKGHINSVDYYVRHIFPSLIFPNTTGLIDNQLDNPILIVGILSYEIMLLPEKKQPLEWKTGILKLLGDPVRYQILLKSKEQPVYLSELARQLDLKPSTVSHHLNALNAEKLLLCDVSEAETRKQYYTLNRETIAQLIRELNELV